MRRLFFTLLLCISVGGTVFGQVASAEYYIDTDPGYGSAIPVSITPGSNISRDLTISLASQTTGFHVAGLRAKDVQGHWSHTYLHRYFVTSSINTTAVAAEYFIDTDPGTGKATQLSAFSSANTSLNYVIPLTGLAEGFHVLGTRAKDNFGKWSHTMLSTFFVNDYNEVSPVSALQYYFTGEGATDSIYTHRLPEPSPVADLDFTANLSQLAGNREYTMHIWAVNTKGKKSAEYLKKIKVCSGEVAQAGYDFIPLGTQVSFSDSSRGGATYKWDFGDGKIDSVSNPVHTYAVGGNYTVKQIVSNFCNSDTVVKVVPVVSLQSVHTNAGGNTGRVTVTITGAGFNSKTEVKLIKDGVEITGINNSTTDNGNLLNATFDLTGKDVGEWDLQANNGSNSALLNNVFTIENGVEPNIQIDIVGRTTFRAGRPEKFTIKYTNTGNINGNFIPITLLYPKGVDVKLNNALVKLSGNYGLPEIDEENIPPVIELGDSALISLIVPVIPGYGKGEFEIELTAPPVGDIPVKIFVSDPLDGKDTCLITRVGAALSLVGGTLAILGEKNPTLCKASLVFSAGSAITSLMSQYNNYSANEGTDKNKYLKNTFISGASLATSIYSIYLGAAEAACSAPKPVTTKIGIALALSGIAISAVDYWVNPECRRELLSFFRTLSSIASFDPNEKVGPTGNTIANYYQGVAPFNYTIYFENKSTATAPAQEVIITDTLDTSKFDLSTFQLQSYGYGNTTKTYIPPGLSAYFGIDTLHRPGKSAILVKTDAKLDTVKGILTWRFLSLNPQTREIVNDPLDGFLPPNIVSPQGEGFVSYSVKPKAGLSHGTEIKNKATIYFDNNAPITTNEFLNTLDKVSPVSAVKSGPSEVNDTTFTVQWDGSDNGAGIRSYDVYYKVNNGEYRLWQYDVSSTQDSFTGQKDSTYSFFSVSKDYAGNIENVKTSAERTVTITIKRDEPPGTEPSQNIISIYPNPAQGRLNVRFNEPQTGGIKWRIIDALGRILLLNENQFVFSDNSFSIDVTGLPKGLYFLSITGSAFNRQAKFVKQ